MVRKESEGIEADQECFRWACFQTGHQDVKEADATTQLKIIDIASQVLQEIDAKEKWKALLNCVDPLYRITGRMTLSSVSGGF
jgi:hypothetical protein